MLKSWSVAFFHFVPSILANISFEYWKHSWTFDIRWPHSICKRISLFKIKLISQKPSRAEPSQTKPNSMTHIYSDCNRQFTSPHIQYIHFIHARQKYFLIIRDGLKCAGGGGWRAQTEEKFDALNFDNVYTCNDGDVIQSVQIKTEPNKYNSFTIHDGGLCPTTYY